MTASGNIEQEVLLIAGRSGNGKTSVSFEVSDQLQKADVAHCLVDGDNLDTAYQKPAGGPHGIGLTEANLTALWRNYTGVGPHRFIYVTTVSVLESGMIIRSLGGATQAIEVILTATDATVLARLTSRESRWSAGASSATQLGDGPPTWTPQRPGYRESLPTGGRSSTWQRTSLRQPGGPQRQRNERRTLRRVSAPQAVTGQERTPIAADIRSCLVDRPPSR